MGLGIRKTASFAETIFIEGGKIAARPAKLAAAAAVINNPWAGRGFVEDLRPEILRFAPALAEVLVPMLIESLGGGDKIEAYGKAAACAPARVSPRTVRAAGARTSSSTGEEALTRQPPSTAPIRAVPSSAGRNREPRCPRGP